MEPSSTNISNQANQQVIVTVENPLPYGVFVRLDNGMQGYIRRREMSWEGNVDPRKLVEADQQIEAVIIKNTKHDGKLELSHRLTLPDPWYEFVANYRKGGVIDGCVKDIQPGGIFVEILPGVDGFVPLSQLASWPIQEPGELFWLDDKIEAVITQINTTKRNVRLSIRRRMKQQTAVHSIMEQLGTEEIIEPDDESFPFEPPEENSIENEISSRVDSIIVEQVGPVLIVEDGDDLRDSFVQWLRERGFQVSGACDVTTAMQQIENQCFGICFVDLDLPDVDGLTFIRHLRQKEHDSHVIVMSSSEWLVERAQDIEQAGVLTVLFKPLDLNEINNLLHQIGRGNSDTLHWQHSLSPGVESAYNSFQNLANMMQSGISFEQRLQRGLEQVFELTESEVGIIFYKDPISQTFSIKAQVGRAALNEDALFSLVDSPVKDVLRERLPIFEENVSTTAHRRFQKLLNLLPFESCIGIPLGDGIGSEYALFLFHRKRRAFSRYRLRDAQSVAVLLTVALERQALEQRIQAISSILLSGQLAAGFGHEINNKISAMEIQLRNIQMTCADLDNDSSRSVWQDRLTQAREAQNGILETVIDLKKTVRLFQNLTKGEHKPGVDVNQAIRQAHILLQPILSKEKIRLTLDLSPDLPPVPGSIMRLQQVFLNIMLNAVQHMTSHKDKERRLNIATTLTDRDNVRPLNVSITDTGTGIHKQLWQKIFDLGFSTRADGTGLGLFIARSLAESMGGHVYVERSFIPIGTIFVVELPIVKEKES
ncbi:MAG: S1 RNA-binding domain-containing protein [Anaerolineales bacterium]|nr:S1 RNA-binding domain-containing protein [Anaerolineales bacterium]